jgi:hypothetical protein
VDIFGELEQVINSMVIKEVDDRWVWRPDVGNGFSVKSLYESLDHILLPRNVVSSSEEFAFRTIWKSATPSKVSALAWQVFLNRIPTKENLCRRGILRTNETACVLCRDGGESVRHLFLHCDYAVVIWYSVCRWLGVVVVLPAEVVMSYGVLVGSGINKKIRRGYSVVWLAFIWV